MANQESVSGASFMEAPTELSAFPFEIQLYILKELPNRILTMVNPELAIFKSQLKSDSKMSVGEYFRNQIEAGDLDFIDFLVKNKHLSSKDELQIAYVAFTSDNVKSINYAFENSFNFSKKTLNCIAKEDKRISINAIINHGVSYACEVGIYESAILHGNLYIIKLLHRKDIIHASEKQMIMSAVKYGHFHILEWMLNTFDADLALHNIARDNAIRFNQVSVLKWLHGRYCEFDDIDDAIEAVSFNSFDVIRFLHSVGCPLDKSSSNSASVGIFVCESPLEQAIHDNNLKAVEFLYTLGIKCTEDEFSIIDPVANPEIYKFINDQD